MKKFKKMFAIALAMVMVLGMSISVFAAPVTNNHTITITNTDQNVEHKYEAYKVFSGNLDATESKLADIAWADGVNATNLAAALKASEDTNLVAKADGKDALGNDITAGTNLFANCSTAQDFAKVFATFTSTTGASESAGAIDAVAAIIADNLGTKTADFTTDADEATKYTANVTGDGYYFIKDTTTALTNEDKTSDNYKGSDTLSKYLLAVVKDTTIVAKDTGILPDKKILGEGTTKLAADSAAIGDTVDFEVTIKVPNTKKYDDHFVFVMNDQLPAGITFTGITAVTVGSKTLTDTGKASPAPTFDDDYQGTDGYYTLKVNSAVPGKDATETTKYTFEASTYDAVAEAGGQAIELTFNEFKKFVEKNNLIGEDVTIQYKGVVNDDASYKATANENEVTFDYSNDPNHDYHGDNFGPQEPKGTTPESKTRTYTTSLKIKKVDENGEPLAGATFELKGTALNRTVITGYKFVEQTYTPKNGEVVDASASYWELKDGSYTTTDPTTEGMNDTQYVDKNKKFYRVTYTQDEVATKETDIKLVTGADGIAEFVGLNEGNDYTLEEIAAPDGYNKIDGKANITIAWSDPEATDATSPAKDQGGFTLSATGDASFKDAIQWNATDKQFTVQIENKQGSTLPSTGGMGTTILYLIGTILVLGAGILLVTKRRMSVN